MTIATKFATTTAAALSIYAASVIFAPQARAGGSSTKNVWDPKCSCTHPVGSSGYNGNNGNNGDNGGNGGNGNNGDNGGNGGNGNNGDNGGNGGNGNNGDNGGNGGNGNNGDNGGNGGNTGKGTGIAKSTATGGTASTGAITTKTGPSTSAASTGAITTKTGPSTSAASTGASTSAASDTATTGSQVIKGGNTTYNTKVAAFTPNVEGGSTPTIVAATCQHVHQRTGWGLNAGAVTLGIGVSSPGTGDANPDKDCIQQTGENAVHLQHEVNKGEIGAAVVASQLPCEAIIRLASAAALDLAADDKSASIAACANNQPPRVVYVPTPEVRRHNAKRPAPAAKHASCPDGKVLRPECVMP